MSRVAALNFSTFGLASSSESPFPLARDVYGLSIFFFVLLISFLSMTGPIESKKSFVEAKSSASDVAMVAGSPYL